MRRRRRSSVPSSPPAAPIARISRPGELALLMPQLLGFTPHESVVALALREPRGRLGLVQRLDLPTPGESMPPFVVDQIIQRALEDDATRILFAIWTETEDTGGGHPHTDLVDRLCESARGAGLRITDALLVRSGRWWSYRCEQVECCPPEGSALADDADGEGLGLAAAEAVLDGRAVLASREELERSIAGVHPLGEELTVELLAQAALQQGVARAEDRAGQEAAVLRQWEQALDTIGDPRGRVDDDTARTLIASLLDPSTRDRVVWLSLDHLTEMQRLLEQLCRRSAPPFDATLCSTLGWVAYMGGGGAIVTIAADRALADCPDFSAAHTLLSCLDAGVRPEQMRSMVEEASRCLGPHEGQPVSSLSLRSARKASN